MTAFLDGDTALPAQSEESVEGNRFVAGLTIADDPKRMYGRPATNMAPLYPAASTVGRIAFPAVDTLNELSSKTKMRIGSARRIIRRRNQD